MRFVKRLQQLAAALTFACVLDATTARAISVSFEGTEQSHTLIPTASGFGTVQGALPITGYLLDDQALYAIGNITLADDSFTYVVNNNPTTVGPLVVSGISKIIGQPKQVGVPPVGSVFPPANTQVGFTDEHLTSVSGLNLLLFTGIVGVAIDGIDVPRTLMNPNPTYNGEPEFGPPYWPQASSPVNINLLCRLGTTYFEQDLSRDASFVPTGPGVGTYSIPALLHVDFDPSLRFFSFIPGPELPATSVSAPFDLVGTYAVTGPPDDATLVLDGSQTISVPLLGFSHAIAAESGTRFGLTATIDLGSAALDFALNYHLTTQVAIPEPGSVLLLAIGLAALGPVAARKLRRIRRPA
ncbi:MAG: PEP-CTERM sorting domain-containing protein [Pirellulales bacterium]